MSIKEYLPDPLVELASSYAESCVGPLPEYSGRFEEFDSEREMAEVLRALEEEGYEFRNGTGFERRDDEDEALISASMGIDTETGLRPELSAWSMPGMVIQDNRIYAVGTGDYKTLQETVDEAL